MKKYLLAAFTCLIGLMANAQQPTDFCGSHHGRSEWLKHYQLKPDDFAKGGDTTMYVPLTIHILGTDAGAGYYSMRRLLDAFCLLNELFEPSGIQFFIEGEINYINNTAYYDHETVLEGGEMMFEHNVANTLNCYFVSDPAGNCGYNLPYAGIAVAKSCAADDDITWAHEIGHGFGLPHPFLGWEGGISWDDPEPPNFNEPAPTTVTYNYTYFQTTLILDTLIIDTAYVELVDGTNCTFAADGFCDTAPDYLATPWSCNADGISSIVQTDPNGATFQSDGSLIMNYANDACQNRFSSDQQQAMRAFLLDERPEWLYDQSPAGQLSSAPVLLTAPEDAALVAVNEVNLSWDAIDGASSYLVEVNRLAGFQEALSAAYVVTGTSFLVPDLIVDRTYYWRVRPFNNYTTCHEPSDSRSFITDVEVAVQQIKSVESWRIFPNPIKGEQTLNLEWQMENAWNGNLALYNAFGQKISTRELHLQLGQNSFQWELNDLPAGVYFIRMENLTASQVQRIIIE